MIVTCNPCPVCGVRSVLHDVNPLGYRRWYERVANIQDALPELDEDQRELLMTGTHAHCWDIMWKDAQ